KYHSLSYEDELQLRLMEDALQTLPDILYFHRTKCNGFHIAFESPTAITIGSEYEAKCLEAVKQITPCAPHGTLDTGGFLMLDHACLSGNLFWTYPRIHHPVWLNPKRTTRHL